MVPGEDEAGSKLDDDRNDGFVLSRRVSLKVTAVALATAADPSIAADNGTASVAMLPVNGNQSKIAVTINGLAVAVDIDT